MPAPWVVIAEAGAPAKGIPTLLEAGEPGDPVLAGVRVSNPWKGRALSLLSEDGTRCDGVVTEVYEGAAARWPANSEGWVAGCADLAGCTGAVAKQVWRQAPHRIVGQVTLASPCAAPRWAHVVGSGTAAAAYAQAVDDDALANLAVASFRQLRSWGELQTRWLRTVWPLDSTEWDTAAGAAPEVASFRLPSGRRVLTVSSRVGDGCPGDYDASLLAAFEVGQGGRSLKQLSHQPRGSEGFAPRIAAEFDGELSFADGSWSAVSGDTPIPAFIPPLGGCAPRR